MSEPVITVLLPTFNRSQLLRRAVRSIQCQDYGNFVVKIFDNASTDDTERVAAELCREDSRIVYFRKTLNIGLVLNFFDALRHADSDYFCLLQDDDFLFPGHFSSILEIFRKNPSLGCAFGNVEIVSDKGKILTLNRSWHEGLYRSGDAARHMARVGGIAWHSALFRREVLEIVENVDPRAGYAMDIHFQLKVAMNFDHYCMEKPVAGMMAHDGNAYKSVEVGLVKNMLFIIQDMAKLETRPHVMEKLLKKAFGKNIWQLTYRRLGELRAADVLYCGASLVADFDQRITGLFIAASALVSWVSPALAKRTSLFLSWIGNQRRERRERGAGFAASPEISRLQAELDMILLKLNES